MDVHGSKYQAETPGHHLDPTVKISSSYSLTKSWTQKNTGGGDFPPQNTNPTKNGAPNDTFIYAISYATNLKVQIEHDDIISIGMCIYTKSSCPNSVLKSCLKGVLTILLLMAEILHQLTCSLSHYLQGFKYPNWCRISAINRSTIRV